MLRDQSQFSHKTGGENGNAVLHESSPALSEEPLSHLATEVIEEEVAAVLPSSRVVASITEPANQEGMHKVIQTLETSMRDRFVRVERLVSRSASGGIRVSSEVAMVANQLMLKKPVGMADYIFLEMLGRAGATKVKELGEGAFLATFEARPLDPKALEEDIARVQELAGVEISAEPNYIGRVF